MKQVIEVFNQFFQEVKEKFKNKILVGLSFVSAVLIFSFTWLLVLDYENFLTCVFFLILGIIVMVKAKTDNISEYGLSAILASILVAYISLLFKSPLIGVYCLCMLIFGICILGSGLKQKMKEKELSGGNKDGM